MRKREEKREREKKSLSIPFVNFFSSREYFQYLERERERARYIFRERERERTVTLQLPSCLKFKFITSFSKKKIFSFNTSPYK